MPIFLLESETNTGLCERSIDISSHIAHVKPMLVTGTPWVPYSRAVQI